MLKSVPSIFASTCPAVPPVGTPSPSAPSHRQHQDTFSAICPGAPSRQEHLRHHSHQVHPEPFYINPEITIPSIETLGQLVSPEVTGDRISRWCITNACTPTIRPRGPGVEVPALGTIPNVLLKGT